MRLTIEENDGNIAVAVYWSEYGQREQQGYTTSFTRPLTSRNLADLQFYLEEYLALPNGSYAARGEAVENVGLSAWGEALFHEVFEHPAGGAERRNAFGQLRAAVARGEPAHVSIASRDPRFLALPWELLKAPEDLAPIVLSVSTFDRTFPQHVPAVAFPDVVDGVRILMVIARPKGVRDAPFQSVARRLFQHLDALGEKVRVEVLRPPSFSNFRRRLLEACDARIPFHLVHFDGHGTFGVLPNGESTATTDWFFKTKAAQGYLCFETEGGERPELVSAADFAGALREGRTPCVVLNACRSGMFGEDEGGGVEATVATRLIAEGVASVVAMTHSVYVMAASALMSAFYDRLFSGYTISESLNHARRSLRSGSNSLRPSQGGHLRSLQDWMVPVHYQRSHLRLMGVQPSFEKTHQNRSKEKRRSGNNAIPHFIGELLNGGPFFGRDAEFYVLERAMRGSHICVIHGMGGAGKTELAKGFARWLRMSGGLDGQAHVFFQSYEPGRAIFGLDQVINPIFDVLSQRGQIRVRRDTIEEREKAVLSALHQQRCLLVWDNFETALSLHSASCATPPLTTAEQVRISAFLKQIKRGKSAIIITSRSPEVWLENVHSDPDVTLLRPGDLVRLEIGGLRQADALAYADRLMAGDAAGMANRQEDRKGFSDLITYLNGHPLCLRLILPHLNRRFPSSVLASLRGRTDALAGGSGTGHLDNLTANIDVSLKTLPPLDRERLYILALFESTVSVGLLRAIAIDQDIGGLSRDVAVPFVLPARFGGVGPDEWERLLTRAVQIGVIGNADHQIFRLHPALPQTLGVAWVAAAGNNYLAERDAAEGALVAGAAYYASSLQGSIEDKNASSSHTLASLQLRGLEAILDLALIRKSYTDAQLIMQLVNFVWSGAIMYEVALAWFDRALYLVSESGIPEYASPAGALWRFILNEKGHLALMRGDPAAARANQEAILMQAAKSADLGARETEAGVYHEIGILDYENGRVEDAGKSFELSVVKSLQVGQVELAAGSYYQLAIIARDQSRLIDAHDLVNKSLRLFNECNNTRGAADCYMELSLQAIEKSDYSQAEHWMQKAHAFFRSINDYSALSHLYHLIGNLAQKLGYLDAAEGWFRAGLAIHVQSKDVNGIGRLYFSLGILAHARGDIDLAESWYKPALERFVESQDNQNADRVREELNSIVDWRRSLNK